MVVVRTDLGDLRESARRTRFEQTGDITATSVQEAIHQLDTIHGLNFTRNPQTANYAVQNTDKGNLLALGGNALFTLTINAASGYDANFAIIVHNEDAGRGKVIAANGRTSFILWPHQTVLIFNDNNAWKFSPDTQRWLPVGAVAFQVDNVNGSDSATNDGLGAQGTSGCFATIAHAMLVIQRYVDQAAYTAQIQLPPVTSTPIVETLELSGAMPVGISEISVVGNPASPTSCQWSLSTNNNVYCSITDYLSVTFNGVGFSASGGATGNNFVNASQYAIADFYSCDFGANASGIDISASANARANILTGCSISGSCGQFLQASDNASCACGPTLTINGTPNVGFFANALFGATIDFGGSLTFAGAGTLSGQQFQARWAGSVRGDSSVSWPGGMSAGTATIGGLSDAATTTFGAALVTSPSAGGLGYGAGAGGTVTQATNKSTAVTLNKASGSITLNSATLSAATVVSFTLTNSAIAATDVLVLNHNSGGTPGSYTLNAQAGAGAATVNVRNNTAGNLAEAIVISFVLIKGAQS